MTTKRALLVVSFGTTYQQTREVTLEAAERDFAEAFPDRDVFTVYTSRTVKRILKKRDNIDIFNLEEAFAHLIKCGYQDVLVQSLHIMNGSEFHIIAKKVAQVRNEFSNIYLGPALLTRQEDYAATIEAIKPTFPAATADSAVVLMGHGSHHPSNAAYSMLENMLKRTVDGHIMMATVEGFPAFDDMLLDLKKTDVKHVTLMPFMIVAGDHAINDLASDEEDSWKSQLQAAGYDVTVYLHGIGELAAIRQIFVEHAKDALTARAFKGHGGVKV